MLQKLAPWFLLTEKNKIKSQPWGKILVLYKNRLCSKKINNNLNSSNSCKHSTGHYPFYSLYLDYLKLEEFAFETEATISKKLSCMHEDCP